MAKERLIDAPDIVINVPFAIDILSVISPESVCTGSLKGMTSSAVACGPNVSVYSHVDMHTHNTSELAHRRMES
jgi:hypothetical protein